MKLSSCTILSASSFSTGLMLAEASGFAPRRPSAAGAYFKSVGTDAIAFVAEASGFAPKRLP